MAIWRYAAIATVAFILAVAVRHRSKAETPCTAAQIEQIEKVLYGSLERAVSSLQKEKSELAADNARLRQRLDHVTSATSLQLHGHRGDSADSTAGATVATSPCGEAPAALHATALWRNRHGRMVRRHVAASLGRLSLCKRARTPELEVPLPPGTTVTPVPVPAAEPSVGPASATDVQAANALLRVTPLQGREVVLQLASAAQRDAWAGARRRHCRPLPTGRHCTRLDRTRAAHACAC